MKRERQKGSALILALILLLVVSVMGISLTFLSRTEVWSSMNYRMMTQARYGAEAGLDTAMNYIINSYAPPATGGGDPIASYTLTTEPVTTGACPLGVVLSSNPNMPACYPGGGVQKNFNQAVQGSVQDGNTTVNYTASATLLWMRQVFVYGSPTPVTVQTWQITSDGTISSVRNADVQVSAILERPITPSWNYAAFGAYNGCGALSFSGGGKTDSYDSSNIQKNGNNVVTQQYGGNIGANGNLNESGSPTVIYGTMSTPRTGVGSCAAGGVDAWTNSGNAQVTGGMVQLPQPVTYPPPTPPNPLPPTDSDLLTKNACGFAGCSKAVPGPGWQLAPGSYGNISISGGAILHLSAGTYNINSISLTGTSEVVIDSGPVIINVAGQGVTTVVDFTGGTLTNASLNPANLQIEYAGTGNIYLSGGAAASGLVYAPNATISFTGGADWYGAVIGQFVKDAGGTAVHYDRQLQNEFFTIGNWMLDSFTWNKY